MPGSNPSLNAPDDSTCTSLGTPDPSPDKREVPPLFLSPQEKRRAEDLTPPGLSNPFWRP